MQTLDVQPQIQTRIPGMKTATGGKTGAETARNGSSFLAIIEKMIAGTMEGAKGGNSLSFAKMAGRGAGDEENVPGEDNTLIKPGSGKKNNVAVIKKETRATPKVDPGAKTVPVKTGFEVTDEKGSADTAKVLKARHPLTDAGPGKDAKTTAEALDIPIKKADEKEAGKMPSDGEGAEKAVLSLFQKHSPAILPETGTAVATDAGNKIGTEQFAKNNSEQAASTTARNDRKDRKTFISVRDNRTDAAEAAQSQSLAVKSTEIKSDNTADMAIGFRTAENGQSTAGETRQLSEKHDSDGQNFSSMLSQELKNNAADFVKTGQIVLKDNNSGLIRLTLHPESLGNVKISLELSGDHKISGKIVVSSQEAYDAFNENLDGFSDAFVQGGFESAGFDLSWSGSGKDGGNQEREAQTAAISPFYASSIPNVMSASETADTVKGGYRNQSLSAINVFA